MRDQCYPQDQCNTYWGSHGCGLLFNHDGPCICWPRSTPPCSTYERGIGVRLYNQNTAKLMEPMPDYPAWGDMSDDEKTRA